MQTVPTLPRGSGHPVEKRWLGRQIECKTERSTIPDRPTPPHPLRSWLSSSLKKREKGFADEREPRGKNRDSGRLIPRRCDSSCLSGDQNRHQRALREYLPGRLLPEKANVPSRSSFVNGFSSASLEGSKPESGGSVFRQISE